MLSATMTDVTEIKDDQKLLLDGLALSEDINDVNTSSISLMSPNDLFGIDGIAKSVKDLAIFANKLDDSVIESQSDSDYVRDLIDYYVAAKPGLSLRGLAEAAVWELSVDGAIGQDDLLKMLEVAA